VNEHASVCECRTLRVCDLPGDCGLLGSR
jgi:hypothetical protein